MSVNPRRYGNGRLIIELIKTIAEQVDRKITYGMIAHEAEISSGNRERIRNNLEESVKELRADNITLVVELFRRLYLRKKVK